MNKKDTKMIQGLSVLAMVCLHLFDTLEYAGLFTPLVFFKGFPLVFYFAQLSDFCVMGFAFCSGYAHMTLFDEKDYYKKRLRSLFSLYCNFWIILLLFTLVSVAIGQADFMPGSILKFLKTFTTVSPAYNGAWWYLPVYAVLVFIFPIVLKASKKMNSVVILLFSFAVYIGGYWLRFKHRTPYEAINWFGPFGTTFFEYMLGVVCRKERIFEKCEKYVSRIKPIYVYLISFVVFAAMLLGHTLAIRSFIVAPFTGLAIVFIVKFCKKPKFIEKSLMFFGNHSTNIWFTHMFFYLVLFKNLVYMAKYPLFIYLFMIAICVAVSYIINLIYYPIQKQIGKIGQRI